MAEVRKKKVYRKIFWIGLVVSIMILFAIIYVFPEIVDSLTPTYVAKYDTVVVSDEAECYVVRDEIVITASHEGRITYFMADGERARKGTGILNIGGQASYRCSFTGTVSYHTDGKEALFTPETMMSLKRSEIESMQFDVVNMVKETALLSDPVYKLIKGNTWHVIIWVDSKDLVKYKKNSTVTLALEDGQVSGVVEEIVEQDGNYLIAIQFTEGYPRLGQLRKIKGIITTLNAEGLMVRSESLTTKDDQIGVYVRALNGEYVFKPVKVLTISGDYSLVASGYFEEMTPEGAKRIATIGTYDEILKNGSSGIASPEEKNKSEKPEPEKDNPAEEENE